MRKLPFVEAKIQSELNKMMEGTLKELKGQTKGIPFHTRIPEAGWNREKGGYLRHLYNVNQIFVNYIELWHIRFHIRLLLKQRADML